MQEQSAMDAVSLAINIGIPLLIIGTGLVAGSVSERRHEKSLRKRERELADVETTAMRSPPGFKGSNGPCALVSGEAVVASDTFKSWIFGIKNIVGGESKSFTRLFDRARREALLRMKAQAKELGFNAVCNVRFDSADIGGNAAGAGRKRGSNMAVALASGTAWRREA